MKFIRTYLITVLLLSQYLTTYANSSNNIILTADRYYSKDDLLSLYKLYTNNLQNRTVFYFYAKAAIKKKNPNPAEIFIKKNQNDYMRSDLIHSLLAYYLDKDQFVDYLRVFKLLSPDLASNNEKCGHDFANLRLGQNQNQITNTKWLIANSIPLWCAKFISMKYDRGMVDETARDFMLYNLIANDKPDILNKIITILKANDASNLPSNNEFNKIYKIINLAKKYPEEAYSEFNNVSLKDTTQSFLNNYLAMQFARKHQFDKAIKLYNKYGENLSDDGYEWLARSYLYAGNWEELINTINSMPNELKNKNIWLYWLAKAYDGTNQSAKSTAILNKIPNDYSYYSLVAHAELNKPILFKNNPPPYFTLSDSNTGKDAKLALELYNLGKSHHSKSLNKLGISEWNFAVKNCPVNHESDLLAMSNITHKEKIYDLSIAAANQLKDRYMELSFPIPFKDEYIRYTKQHGIDLAYALAITRQESRFNYNVIAFDGGVGLMQIMPQTALYISQKSGSPNCYRQSPSCNIKFGTWYLGNLYNKFPNYIYSTASYNAGPARPKKWYDKLGNLENIVQIELIPIAITRDYVQKVLTNKLIYENQLSNSKIDLFDYISKINNKHYKEVTDDDKTDANKL